MMVYYIECMRKEALGTYYEKISPIFDSKEKVLRWAEDENIKIKDIYFIKEEYVK